MRLVFLVLLILVGNSGCSLLFESAKDEPAAPLRGDVVIVSPDSAAVNFGHVAIDVQSTAEIIRWVALRDTDPLQTTINVDANVFSVQDDCVGKELKAGGFCNMTVTFTPNSEAGATGTIEVGTLPEGLATLNGDGYAPGLLTIMPNQSYTFKEVINGTVRMQEFTVENTSDDSPAMVTFDLDDSGDDDKFTLADGCSQSLAPRESCELTVTYQANGVGTDQVVLNVKGDGGDVSAKVTLIGEVFAPTYRLNTERTQLDAGVGIFVTAEAAGQPDHICPDAGQCGKDYAAFTMVDVKVNTAIEFWSRNVDCVGEDCTLPECAGKEVCRVLMDKDQTVRANFY